MTNPKIADAPCLRCGSVVTWKRNKAGKPYAWCTAAGGCGAVITLGAADPFPDPLHGPPADGIGDAPAPVPRSAPAHPPKPKAQPEPEPDDGAKPRADDGDDDGNPWGLY